MAGLDFVVLVMCACMNRVDQSTLSNSQLGWSLQPHAMQGPCNQFSSQFTKFILKRLKIGKCVLRTRIDWILTRHEPHEPQICKSQIYTKPQYAVRHAQSIIIQKKPQLPRDTTSSASHHPNSKSRPAHSEGSNSYRRQLSVTHHCAALAAS